MSTRFDILDARKRARSHVCGSQCVYPCPIQRDLNQEHIRIAGRWGEGEDGESFDERQRRQYNERVNGS